MTKDGSFGGPEWVKACGECDGPPDKSFRKRWGAWRKLRRAPQSTDWTDEEWNAMHEGCPPEFLRGDVAMNEEVIPDTWSDPENAPLHVLAHRHNHKGYSEEMCIRCGWIMGHPPLNCQNDNSPHIFPSQQVEYTRLMDGLEYAWAVIANGRAWDEAQHDEWEQAKFRYRDEHWHPALDRNKEARSD